MTDEPMTDEPMTDEQLLASALNRILKREFPGETGPLKVSFQFYWKPDHIINVTIEVSIPAGDLKACNDYFNRLHGKEH